MNTEKSFIPVDLRKLEDYSYVKERLVVQLENKNMKLSDEVLETRVLDMKMTYGIAVSVTDERMICIKMTRDMFSHYHITLYELYQDAIKSTEKLFPVQIISVNKQYLKNNPSLPDNVLCVTNANGPGGASVILYPDTLTQIHDYFGSNYYLLPSSTREWIAVKDNPTMTVDFLKGALNTVNRSLESNLLLSDHIYFYDILTESIHMI